MVKSAKTMPGANCEPEHELLVATIGVGATSQAEEDEKKLTQIENSYNLCDIPER